MYNLYSNLKVQQAATFSRPKKSVSQYMLKLKNRSTGATTSYYNSKAVTRSSFYTPTRNYDTKVSMNKHKLYDITQYNNHTDQSNRETISVLTANIQK